mgnify:CR=1 FL=1
MQKARTKRRTSKKAAVRRLDAEFRKLIMQRDGWTCQKCGKAYPEGSRGIQVSHFYTKGQHEWMRYDPDDACAMCFRCHLIWWHYEPLEAAVWLKGYLGDEKYEALWRKAQSSPKIAATHAAVARRTRETVENSGKDWGHKETMMSDFSRWPKICGGRIR